MTCCCDQQPVTAAKTHVSLNVRDVERSVAFYEAFFGVAAHKRRPGYANFDLATPPLKLALQEFTPAGGYRGALASGHSSRHVGGGAGGAGAADRLRPRHL